MQHDAAPETPKQPARVASFSLRQLAPRLPQTSGGDAENYFDRPPQGFVAGLVMLPQSRIRMWWTLIIAVLLLYTGTLMPYRLVFLDFRINTIVEEDSLGWQVFETIVDYSFRVDLIMNFLFAVENSQGDLVRDPRQIAKLYLRGWFWLDLIACLPKEVFDAAMGSFSQKNDANRAVRLSRMYRVGRVMRLASMARMARVMKVMKLFKFIQQNTLFQFVARAFGQSRLAVVLKFLLFLFLALHLLGCGWYLMAWSSASEDNTWVHRRGLVDAEPYTQWLNSVYFILTVFTSVGFGDMKAVTPEEIVYAKFLMLLGAVVQSVVISEVINVLTDVDIGFHELEGNRMAVKAFVNSCTVSSALEKAMLRDVEYQMNHRSTVKYDRTRLHNILSHMPKEMQIQLQTLLFGGSLVSNAMFANAHGGEDPRLVILTAVHLTRTRFQPKHQVYEVGDQPHSLFFVVEGTVAFTAIPTPQGGVVTTKPALGQMLGLRRSPSVKDDSGAQFQKRFRKRAHMTAVGGEERHDPCPYQLQSFRTFFGEYELLFPHPRITTARTERDTVALELPRYAFVLLITEFPQFLERLRRFSRRREERRRQRLRQLTAFQCGSYMAAGSIQNWWRSKMRRFRARAVQSSLQAPVVPSVAGPEPAATVAGTALDVPKPAEPPTPEPPQGLPRALASPLPMTLTPSDAGPNDRPPPLPPVPHNFVKTAASCETQSNSDVQSVSSATQTGPPDWAVNLRDSLRGVRKQYESLRGDVAAGHSDMIRMLHQIYYITMAEAD